MAARPYPDLMLHSIYELTPETLESLGIRLLLLDLDNTLAKYSTDAPTPELTGWISSLRAAGIEPFILSNNHKHRPEVFGSALGIEWRNPLHDHEMDLSAIRGVAEKHGLLLMENSDAHYLGDLGKYWNETSVEELCARASRR